LTWVDLDNNGKIQTTLPLPQQGGTAAAELIEFSTSNATTLCPYLGNVKTSDGATPTPHNPSAINCNNTASPADQTSAQSAATNLINFIRGNVVPGLRDRRITTTDDSGSPLFNATWRLGDILDSSPVAVGAPRERYDIIYGDSTYAGYLQKYKDRRTVIYVGANDGMLHAFNAGYFVSGDDLSTPAFEQVRFLQQPVQPGTSTVCASLPCDGSVTPGYTTRTNSASVPIGAELWAFIPQDLLPQLQWLSNPNYQHAYYVDLTPKITDARIFTPDADHPGGWGTILIGGFRYGGSCTACPSGSAGPRTITSDFSFPADNNTTDANLMGVNPSDTRVFFSSYFVMDITNPEKDPVLLWTARDLNLGLTTSAPVVIRTNPSADPNTSSTNEKWFVVFGSGPTNLDSSSGQTANFYVVDLKQGPKYSAVNQTAGVVGLTTCSSTSPCIAVDTTSPTHTVWTFSTGQSGSVLGDLVSLDFNLDFRTDVVYAGSAICTGGTPSPCNVANPAWRGAMWRLTTNGGDPNPATWGNAGAPSILISNFGYTTPPASTCTGGVAGTNCNVGPALSAPVISTDDNHNIWLFFGTGRFFTNNDKTNTDIQHYFGVKDSFMTMGSPGQGTQRNNLFNVSKVSVCTSCPTSSSIDLGSGSFTSSQATLMNNLQSMDGWFTVLSNAINPPPPPFGERNLSSGTLLGGTIFFTTFVPVNNICVIQGTGFLYGLYYGTGAPYAQAPALGTSTSGPNTVAQKSVSLGYGIPAQMAIQIGGQGTGTAGTSGSGQGCASRVTGFLQTSTGMIQQLCSQPAGSAWSRMLSWRDL
jgi:type IV pilus assembly protein PilY1